MSRRWTLAAALALAAAIGLLAAGCQENPERRPFDNPFDPDGPDGGDPFNTRASLLGNVIFVSWEEPAGFPIAEYSVDRSFDPDTGWGEIAGGLTGVLSYRDSNAVPNQTHYYRVGARLTDGTFTVSDYAEIALVTTPPSVSTDPAGSAQPSRIVPMQVVVGRGDSLRFEWSDSNDVDFVTLLAAAPPGDTLDVDWDLGPRADGDTTRVLLRSFGPDYSSPARTLTFVAAFGPEFTVADAGEDNAVATREVTLEIPTRGVVEMRFAASRSGLDGATPVPAAPTYPWTLGTQATSQSIWGRFLGDFGYEQDIELIVAPALLEDVSFAITNLPDNRVTTLPELRVESDVVATRMRWDDQPDLTSAPWIAFTPDTTVAVPSTPGRRGLYMQYANDWNTSDVAVDSFEFVLVPLSIGFTAPVPGELIQGGENYTLTGRAVSADGRPLGGVQVNLGDGEGFRNVVPTAEYWQYNWTPPVFAADSTLVLQARTFYTSADDTTEIVTTSVEVTVTQLSVTIEEPAAGAAVPTDAFVTVAGIARPDLGAAIDSVTVAVEGATLKADGTDAWELQWRTPQATEARDVLLEATVWQGGETATDAASVRLDPEAR